MLSYNVLKIMGVGGLLPSKYIKRVKKVNMLQLIYVLYVRYILIIMIHLYVGGV